MTTCFLEDDVTRLGEGSYEQGLRKIGHTYFTADPENILQPLMSLRMHFLPTLPRNRGSNMGGLFGGDY